MTAARRLVGILLIASLSLVAGCSGSTDKGAKQDEQKLTTFKGPDFSIDLPGKPTENKQSVPTAAGDLEVVIYTVGNGDAAVAVAVTTAPDGVPLDLDGAVNGAASNIGGTVLSSDPVTVGADEGRDGRIGATQQGVDITTFFRIVVSGQRLVQVQQVVKGKELTTPPASYQDIVDSLVLS